jgi:hypothetical protein
MSVKNTIKGDIFTLVVEGIFSIRALFDALQQGMNTPDFKAPMRALIDARNAIVESSCESFEEPGRFYAEISHCFTPGWAIVASSDSVLFDMARLICDFTDLRGVEMRAYSDIDEAKSRLTWNNSFQRDPFCIVQTTDCRPNFIRSPDKDRTKTPKTAKS